MDWVGSTGDLVPPFSGEAKSELLPINQRCYKWYFQLIECLKAAGGPLMA